MAVEIKQKLSSPREKPRAMDIVYQRMHRRRMQASEKQSHPDREITDERTDDGYALYIRDASHALLSFDQEQLIYAARDSSDQSLFEIPCSVLQEKGVYERIRDGFVKEDDREQFAEIVASSENAGQVMVRYNLRLVGSIAKDYARARKLSRMDLIQEGNIGLMKAVERFEPSYGNKFSTYATWWIRQTIRSAVVEHDSDVRLPVSMGEKHRKVRKFTKQYEREYGKLPSELVIRSMLQAEGLGQDMQDVMMENVLSGNLMHQRSLDVLVGQDKNATLGEIIASEDETFESAYEEVREGEISQALQHALQSLDSRERVILAGRFGLDGAEVQTLFEIGQEFKISKERVRQIEDIAIKKLRTPHVAQRLALAADIHVKEKRSW